MNAELPLRDIHLPDGVSWWPIAPGWWLILVLVIMIAMIIWAIRMNKARQLLRKQALSELQQIELAFSQHQNNQQLASDCSALLRRVCISRFARPDVAGLTGEAWLQFLNQHNKAALFKDEIAIALLHAPYQKEFDFYSQALLSTCRAWLEQLPPPQGVRL